MQRFVADMRQKVVYFSGNRRQQIIIADPNRLKVGLGPKKNYSF